MAETGDLLVTPAWLADHLDDPAVVVVDLQWYHEGSGRARYDAGHIPGAVHVDWSVDLVEPGAPVAFTLASPERFARVMEALGIGDESVVVGYAAQLGSGPHRLWWASRVYGHDGVRVLDGGLERWVAEGRPLSTDPPAPRGPVRWTPRETDRRWLATLRDVVSVSEHAGGRVLDSRPRRQFVGAAVWYEAGPVEAEPDGIARTPRGELRAGHIPGAVNVPSDELYLPNGTMKDPVDLRALFASLGVGPESEAVTYCGCGISASALLFALTLAGFDRARLYDASWEEWGRDPALPVARP
jgi:thiosulfate/3-mercaptopyruvate sulfurtransferase